MLLRGGLRILRSARLLCRARITRRLVLVFGGEICVEQRERTAKTKPKAH